MPRAELTHFVRPSRGGKSCSEGERRMRPRWGLAEDLCRGRTLAAGWLRGTGRELRTTGPGVSAKVREAELDVGGAAAPIRRYLLIKYW